MRQGRRPHLAGLSLELCTMAKVFELFAAPGASGMPGFEFLLRSVACVFASVRFQLKAGIVSGASIAAVLRVAPLIAFSLPRSCHR